MFVDKYLIVHIISKTDMSDILKENFGYRQRKHQVPLICFIWNGSELNLELPFS